MLLHSHMFAMKEGFFHLNCYLSVCLCVCVCACVFTLFRRSTGAERRFTEQCDSLFNTVTIFPKLIIILSTKIIKP